MDAVEILPSGIQIKYDCLKVDDVYLSTITIIKYDSSIQMLKTIETLTCEDELEISFHIKRENNFELLRKLTNIIAETGSEIGSISKNQLDINVIDNVKKRATELRKKIQIDNEQIYMLSTYIVIKGKDYSDVIAKQKRYINKLYASQIIAKPSNFRQKEAYIATLPLLNNNSNLSKYTYSIFTEQALAKLFPFFENDIFSKNGILLGKANNNLCSIDMFSNKNNNYNMCIFGSSGAGKSYFVKLMIIKNAYKGVRQIVIDPEGEYVDLVKSLGGHVYTKENYNPFEIAESFLENPDFFNTKIEEIIEYVTSNEAIQKIIIGMNKEKLKSLITKLYDKYGINETKESLYRLSDGMKVYIKPQYIETFPTINDLIEQIKLDKLEDENGINKEYCNSKQCNSTELYCFSLKGKSPKEIQQEMKIFFPKIYELIKTQTLIYFDEVWKTIGLGQDRFVIENIYNMFKTLRKKKAGIVAISQDICDLFALDGGNFGKSILNNANIKVLFKMEWQDVEMFERMIKTTNIGKNLKVLERGRAYVSMGNTNFNLDVKATEYEHKLIEGENYEENINSNE